MLTITVRTSVPGLHHWPTAPDEVAFLRFPHRHLFGISLTIPVRHNDRDREFFILQGQIHDALNKRFSRYTNNYSLYDFGERSCEAIAEDLIGKLCELHPGLSTLHHSEQVSVSVDEDGENCGTVTISPSDHDHA